MSASEQDLDALIASTPAAHGPDDLDRLIAGTPAASAKPSRPIAPGEGLVHGGVDALPLGQNLSALGTSAVLKLLKLAGNKNAQFADTSVLGQLARENGKLAQSKAERPLETGGGELIGTVAGMAAIPGGPAIETAANANKGARLVNALARVAQASGRAGGYGLLHGYGNGNSLEDSMSHAASEGGRDTLLGALGHAAVGEVAPYFARPLMSKMGEAAQDVAGGLKVGSLNPSKEVAMEMSQLPGGRTGVGRLVLSKGIGGLTKDATAKQAAAALEEAQAGGLTPQNVDNVRRLALAKQAAEEAAANGGSLMPNIQELLLGGLAGQHTGSVVKGAATAMASKLAAKYGPQTAARLLYSGGRVASALGEPAMSRAPSAADSTLFATAAAADPTGVAALIELLRRKPSTEMP